MTVTAMGKRRGRDEQENEREQPHAQHRGMTKAAIEGRMTPIA